ncbi:phospholipase A-2-activating protein-like isoform X2 [Corticium candelabrum]|uniref:phospholipase A-2-activating protein-like isoform X2 n=1 Tax=Corticium candelabrum TaxID=121492 RepID=UPI002E26AD27|nr:phospholipase A-2-activating protein-like isoform X2 [Corticium candelabrum]
MYRLRCQIFGHSDDVRSVTSGPTFIATASRDKTAVVWRSSDEEATRFEIAVTFSGHTGFVSTICFIPSSEDHPRGLLATGCMDKLIRIYDPQMQEPICVLSGHNGNVCALAAGKFGTLLSGSWDCSARVWLNEKTVMTLEGHTAAVWAVGMIADHGLMLTGSADKTIRLWRAGTCERTFVGHDDCVRGLAVISNSEFLSCSNDSSIRRWQLSGECVQIYYGHTAYVYSVAPVINGPGDFVSVGEDRTLRLWQDGECVQTITHPTQTVWCCTCLENGDIVTGANDGGIRIFTHSYSRVASESEIQAFHQQIAAQQVPSNQVGDLKLSDLSGPEALDRPGLKDGQTKVVKVDGKPEVYQWEAASQQWKKIGDVVDAVGSGRRQLLHGKEYDYVFDVQLDMDTSPQSGPPLKLGYNTSEDPWFAAQRFLQDNELSLLYLDQVANYIIEMTKGMSIGSAQPTISDPFTGGSRYIPPGVAEVASQPFPAQSSGQPVSDPLTGGSRYVPSYSQPAPVEAPFQSSFTSQTASSSTNNYFPKTDPLTFDAISNVDAVFQKLSEFNSKADPLLRLSGAAVQGLREVVSLHTNPSQMSSKIDDVVCVAIDQLFKWPDDLVFPALDIMRVIVRGVRGNEYLCQKEEVLVERLKHLASTTSGSANCMLSLRLLCNLFAHASGCQLLMSNTHEVTIHVSMLVECNKGVQIALCSLLLNYAVELSKTGGSSGVTDVLTALKVVLCHKIDNEAAFRALVAVGTLVCIGEEARVQAISLDFQQTASNYLSVTEPKKVAECARLLIAKLGS